jgi:hypothetical protein
MRGRTQMQDVEFARDRNLGSSRSILSSWHPMCADPPSLLYPVALSFFPIQQPETTYHRHSTCSPGELLHGTTSTGADARGAPPASFRWATGGGADAGATSPASFRWAAAGRGLPWRPPPRGVAAQMQGLRWVSARRESGLRRRAVLRCRRPSAGLQGFLPFLFLFVLMQKVL